MRAEALTPEQRSEIGKRSLQAVLCRGDATARDVAILTAG